MSTITKITGRDESIMTDWRAARKRLFQEIADFSTEVRACSELFANSVVSKVKEAMKE